MAFGGTFSLDEVVIEMEFSECKVAAIGINDPRGRGLLNAVAIEAEDSRCRNLVEGLVLEVDDARCMQTSMKMEDPRCRSLHMNW